MFYKEIGETFELNGKIFIVKAASNLCPCEGCDMPRNCINLRHRDVIPTCVARQRTDRRGVIFSEVKKQVNVGLNSKYIYKLISIEKKDGTTHQKDEWKDVFYDWPTYLKVGFSAEIPMSDGRMLRTSGVENFEICDNIMIISTRNSVYTFEK